MTLTSLGLAGDMQIVLSTNDDGYHTDDDAAADIPLAIRACLWR